MRISLAFSGPAGSGINTCAHVIGLVLARYGYDLYVDKEYSSLIKGGNNLCVLCISDSGKFLSKHIDHYIYFDQFGLDKNAKAYSLGAQYFVDKTLYKNQNAFAIGLATRLLGLQREDVLNVFLSRIPEIARDINAGFFEAGYMSVSESGHCTKRAGFAEDEMLFKHGNDIIALGAIAAGLGYYSAYPMTPASSLMDILSRDSRVKFFQGEDEIAVALSMLGAKFAGVRSMCGTSGGGFALMSESIAFSNQAEIGGVYILSQRAGPSTGTPTYTSQSDLHYALNASFGGTFPIVVAPSSFESAYELIGHALNWSDVYQHPVVFLIDKTLSESMVSVKYSDLVSPDVRRGRLEMNPDTAFARYALTEDGISSYTIPGTAQGEFIATSYEHDEFGKDTEEDEVKQSMERKRYQKMNTFARDEFGEIPGFEVIRPTAKNWFVTYGVNRVAMEAFLNTEKGSEWGVLVITILQPMNPGIADVLVQYSASLEKLCFVEQSFTGQFESHFCSQFDVSRICPNTQVDSYRSNSLFPIFEEDLGEKV